MRQQGAGRGGVMKRGGVKKRLLVGVKKRLLAGVKKRLLAGVSSCAGWRLAGEGAPEQDGLDFAAADEGEAYGNGGEAAGCGLPLAPAEGDDGDDDGWDDDQSDTSSVSSFGSVISHTAVGRRGHVSTAAVAPPV
eukprot:COSAG01_NODE_144_length_24108_cov_11.490441_19_plen_135_part_00